MYADASVSDFSVAIFEWMRALLYKKAGVRRSRTADLVLFQHLLTWNLKKESPRPKQCLPDLHQAMLTK